MSIQKFCKTLIYFTVLICPQFFKEHLLMILNYGSFYLHNVLFTILTSYASFCIYITSFNAKVTSQLHFQGSRPFACHICGKSFNMLSSLKVHEHIHVPVKKKPYPCDLCHRLNPSKSHQYHPFYSPSFHSWHIDRINRCCTKLFFIFVLKLWDF